MSAGHGRPISVARRLVGVLACLALLSAVAPAAAITKQQVQRARANAKALVEQVRRAQQQLAATQERANQLATALYEAQYEYDQIVADLTATRARLDKAKARYRTLRARLDARAAEAYMQGPGSSLEFLLGSASLSELSDRLEYMDAAAQTDVELAMEVENLRNQLEADERELERLQEKQAAAIEKLRDKRQEMQALMDRQQALVASIKEKQRKADAYAKKLGREYRKQLAQAFQGKVGDGTFKVCPVDPPRGVSDSFGAPRVGHLHAGVDIFAPMGTPIRAPFDGTARASSGGLGGYSVYVYGAEGYVYNAHLSQPAHNLGSVRAGEVIGYVGTSGNAQGTSPHDHFEWHPNTIPSGWPTSPYGYSVLGDAVNPYPLLTQVC